MEEKQEPDREVDEQPEDRLGMTPEQREQFQAFTHGFGEQSASGVDISLLRANLKLTPTERIETMRLALANYLEVRHEPVGAGICGQPGEPSAERSKPIGDIE